MTLDLTDAVVCGELYHTRHYAVHGWLGLRGYERPLVLSLTGTPAPDMIGCRIRFETRGVEEIDVNQPVLDLSDLAWQQIGPTGQITLAHRPDLRMEWSGQNGPMLVRLVNPVIEVIDEEELEGAMDAAEEPGDLEFGSESDEDLDDFDNESDDPFGPYMDDSASQFDHPGWEHDSESAGEDSASNTIRELELMDELMESGEGDIIGSIFDKPLRFPKPDSLNDEQSEPYLKSLLAEMAVFGIALDVCEHFTPRDVYRVLIDEICAHERAYSQLRQTQWVQHFMTADYCHECEAEFEDEFKDIEEDAE